MKRIVLFVEGEGESTAAPILVNKVLNTIPNVWEHVYLDQATFRVGEINKVLSNDNWRRKLLAANKRKNVGGILMLLDGDIKKIGGQTQCLIEVAKELTEQALNLGAGTQFSVVIVFAIQEFESWLIAGFESLKGKEFPDGRRVAVEAEIPINVETAPRDAKDWFKNIIGGGYRPTRDQAELTRWLDVAIVSSANLRSFQRFESAVTELVNAIKTDQHVATPAPAKERK